jgi:TolB-like protein/Flp pilus assembly protein TadD
MKRCPTCQRVYADETLKFCRHDGAYLYEDDAAQGMDARATLVRLPPAPGVEQPTELFEPAGVGSGAATSSSLTKPLAAQGRRRRVPKVIDSLAVLPLSNETGEPQAEYLSDGISESIINILSQLPRLRVVPRPTAFRYRGREVDPLEAGRELNVRAIVTGRLFLYEDLLVASVELVDVALESQIWGEQYRHKHEDIFTLQERISQEVSEKLRPRLSGDERRRLKTSGTRNAEAYHLYLRGRYYVNKRTTEWIEKGVAEFRKAIELDPAYALAYAGLADAYAFLASSTGERPPKEFYPKAEAAALRALALDDTLAEAHTSLGFYRLLYEWDFGGAEREFKRAVALNPNYANAHDGHSFYLKATGQHERAVAACRRAQKIDPLSTFAHVSLAWAYYFARDYEAAAAQNRKALEMDPRFTFAHWNLGLVRAAEARLPEAVEALEAATEDSGGGLTFKAHLGYVLGLAGDGEGARSIIEELEGLAQDRYVSAYYPAIIRLGLGEHASALDLLERACEERSAFLVFLKVEPMFDPLRTDPRFAALERRLGRG